MPKLIVAFNNTTRVATVLDEGTAVPGGSVNVGTFDHPDLTYPDSLVIYHGVRDLLYKRSAADPSKAAMFPNNIVDMQRVTIDFKGSPRIVINSLMQPTIQVTAGKQARFVTDVTGGKTPIVLNWFKDDVAVNTTDHPSALTQELLLDPVRNEDAGSYHLVVTGADDTVVKSKPYLLVVAHSDNVPPSTLTGITASPAELTLSLADDVAGKNVVLLPVPSTAKLSTIEVSGESDPTLVDFTITGSTILFKPKKVGSDTYAFLDADTNVVVAVKVTVTA